ncbi:MAG: pyridoxamine 5'-phosphate oxidase family protein [Pseudomonadota bacterium]|nr:pyridoxamine 5'-phosphate oxidase family protein [Pseudomonadota bacterium]
MSKNLGNFLDDMAMEQFNAQESTVVVATVSEDGFPNTTPVHLIIAKDPQTLLLALGLGHQATANIRSNPKIMISLCEKNDLNISIRCNAEIICEKMDSNSGMCVVEAKVETIKDDSTHSRTISGIRYVCKTDRGERFIREAFDELKKL